jgi:hypothetical protein
MIFFSHPDAFDQRSSESLCRLILNIHKLDSYEIKWSSFLKGFCRSTSYLQAGKELSYASPLEVGGASNQKKLKWFQLYCIAALLNLEDPKIASIRSDQREKML